MFLKEEENMVRKKKEDTVKDSKKVAAIAPEQAPAPTPAPAPAPAPVAAPVQIAVPTMVSTEKKTPANRFKLLVAVTIFVLLVSNAFFGYKMYKLEQRVSHDSLVYVYSMENVLLLAGMADENKQYQIDLDKLEKEIDAAQKKLNGIKDKKLRQEYSEVYMKSLRLKRDTLTEAHDKFMANLLKNVNRALLKITEKYNAPTIFTAKSIAVHTSNVVDVTDEISKYLKDTM